MKNSTRGDASKATIWFIGGFLALVAVGVIVASIVSGGTGGTGTNFVSTTAPALTSADHVQGDPNSPVSLIEYGDFECPACAQYFPLVTKLVASYNGKIKFAFRHFPLRTIHPVADIAAQAAEAAGLQGKFFEMYAKLYQNQLQWVNSTPAEIVPKFFDGYAKDLGLNVQKFDNDINSPGVKAIIQTDLDGGILAKIDHTPTFFVNQKQIQNPTSYDQFKSILDAVLAATAGTSTATSSAK